MKRQSLYIMLIILACGVVVSGVLGTTDTMSWPAGGESRIAAAQTEYAVSRTRFYVAKEVRLDAQEQLRSTLARRAARNDALLRYYEHKEAQLNALQ